MTISVFFIILGIVTVLLPEKSIIYIAKKMVEIRGLKPHITKTTINYYRYIGAALIGIGIVVAFIMPYYSTLNNF